MIYCESRPAFSIVIFLVTVASFTSGGRGEGEQEGARGPGGDIAVITRSGRPVTTFLRTGADRGSGHARNGASALTNGDFSDELTGWTWSESDGGADPGQVFVDAGQAVMLEGDSFLVTLEQTFYIPAGSATLSFDLILDPGFDLSDDSIPDAFEVTLLNEQGDSAVPTWDPLASSFFNMQEDGFLNLGPGTTWDGLTGAVDVSAVPPGEVVTLYFDFIGADADTAGGVRLDNVRGVEDCNGNGVVDDLDISGGTSADCNSNGIPDECEVPPIGDPANDCNENGVPDDCDVDPNDPDGNGQVSQDCMWDGPDGIPDECQCIGDLDGDDDVDLSDLAILLSNYGMTSGAEYEDGDLDCDGDVDLTDLALLLSYYGTSCE